MSAYNGEGRTETCIRSFLFPPDTEAPEALRSCIPRHPSPSPSDSKPTK